MNCLNKSCNKFIAEPLVLYNGKMACPFCRKDLVNENVVFKITQENNELFELSELFYMSSIKEADDHKKDYFLKNAIDKCRLAALKGHPKAYQRLGFYYDRDYVELNKSKIIRCQMAYQYYSTVCFNANDDMSVDKSLRDRNFSLMEIKKETAELMLKMLYSFEEGQLLDEVYSFKRNYELVKETIGLDFDVNKSTFTTQNKLEVVLSSLRECKNKKRAPLFGIFIDFNVSDLKYLFSEAKYEINSLIKKDDLFLAYFNYSNNDYKEIDSEYLIPLTSFEKIEADIEELENNNKQKVVLFFFNKKNGHHLLSKNDIKYVNNYLRRKDNDYLDGMIYNLVFNYSESYGRVYYDDDIYYYLKSKKLSEALEELKNK